MPAPASHAALDRRLRTVGDQGPARVPGRPGPAGVLVLAASCVLFLALCWVLRHFVTDDAWISVRYAENLAAGHGFVWNPGGPPVEGYSNPGLVGVEALADALGWSALAAARTLGVLCGLACVLLVGLGGRAVVGATAAGAGAVLTAACAPLALWSVAGLETTVVAALLTAAVLQLARPDGGRAGLTGALLAALPWFRPEGLAVGLAVAVLGEAWGLRRRRTRGRAVRRLALVAGLPVLSQAALEVVRLVAFGHLLPNSVLYKSGTGPLLLVLGTFVGQSALVVALSLVAVALVRGRAWLLAVPVVVYAAGSLGTLNSVNAFSRFLLPTWPQLALLAGVTLSAAASWLARRLLRSPGTGRAPAVAAALTALVAAALLALPPADLRTVDAWQDQYRGCRVAAREDMARWLRTATPPGTTFAVADAGLVPARSGGRTAYDSLLLNDPLLQDTGPLPYDVRADLVLDRRPDVLVLTSRASERYQGLYATDRALHDDPRATAYELAHVSGTARPGCRYVLFAYQR